MSDIVLRVADNDKQQHEMLKKTFFKKVLTSKLKNDIFNRSPLKAVDEIDL